MKAQVQARTSPKQVPNVTPVATAYARVVAPVHRSRMPYARALYVAAITALLAACTPPERTRTPDVPERVAPAAATVDSAVVGEELPVVVVQATREMPEVVVTAPRRRVVELIG